MAEKEQYYLIKESTLTGIADAIREKTGDSELIALTDMAQEIEDIPQGDADPEKGVVFSEYDGDGYPHSAKIIGFKSTPAYYLQPYTNNYGAHTFLDKIENIIIADGVTTIGAYLAQSNTNLKKIYLSNTVSTVGQQAFRNTYGLIELSIGTTNLTWDCYYNGSMMGSENGISFIFRNPINSIMVQSPNSHGGFGSTKAILYDFSNNGDVITSISAANIGYKDGCIIRVPVAKLSEWQSATNWCDLPTDPNESGYVVWEGV